MNRGENILVDTCVTILGQCPVNYNVSGDQAEFHFGSVFDGFHFAFDAAALRKLLSLGNDALEELEPQTGPVQAT